MQLYKPPYFHRGCKLLWRFFIFHDFFNYKIFYFEFRKFFISSKVRNLGNEAPVSSEQSEELRKRSFLYFRLYKTWIFTKTSTLFDNLFSQLVQYEKLSTQYFIVLKKS
jgi:hypothetical protein